MSIYKALCRDASARFERVVTEGFLPPPILDAAGERHGSGPFRSRLGWCLKEGKLLDLRVGLAERHGILETVHLPDVPDDPLDDGREELDIRRLSPALLMVVAERQEQIHTRDEEAVALVFVAVAGLIGAECPFRPFSAIGSVLTDDAELAVEEADALFERQDARAGRAVVARDEVGSFAAGDLEAARVDIALPERHLAPRLRREGNRVLADAPGMIRVSRIEYALPAEPLAVEMVVHLVAEPGGGEYLCLFPCARSLILLRFLDARPDASGMAQEGGALHLIGIEEAGAAVRIGVSRPDDVPFRRHVPEQPIEEGTHRGRLDINQIFHWFAFPSVVFSFP